MKVLISDWHGRVGKKLDSMGLKQGEHTDMSAEDILALSSHFDLIVRKREDQGDYLVGVTTYSGSDPR